MTLEVSREDAGLRLDQFLARYVGEMSRARLQQWIKNALVRVNGAAARPSLRLKGGEKIEVPEGVPPAPLRAFPEEIPLEILYEDEDLIAINKPAGMTVHAGAGRTEGTLVNALLHHFAQLSRAGGELRPGIVHRLDRMTSGVLLAAKNDAAHLRLSAQFARRRVRKTYLALVHGSLQKKEAPGRRVVVDGVQWTRLEMPIARDRRRRAKMTAKAREGRAALTDFRVIEEFPGFSLLEVRIGTGRTHQIRVHLSAIGHPVVGDTLYGAPAQPALPRLFLHAREVVFTHPSTGRTLAVQAPLPPDLEEQLTALRNRSAALVLL
jgi:23S rRNA pseudouridine1911/1915/1917 synthase